MKISAFFCCSLVFIFSSCSFFSKTPPSLFDFNHPVETIKLPETLHEISGITFYKKNELACVQDEKGIVYFYDIKKDKLRNNVEFAKNKDYEGIANVNDTLYVLCSNGEISEIDSTSLTGYANTYSTFLSHQNNTEGLCYDAMNNRLLVACKGKPEKKTAPKGTKAIYAFDLEKRKLQKNPVFTIDPDTIESYLREYNMLPEDVADGKYRFAFDPSELTIDPLTQDVYVLSSVGKTIIALGSDGTFKFAYHLNPAVYKQPEGLIFSKDGSLFISDEGKGGKANLVKIKRDVSKN